MARIEQDDWRGSAKGQSHSRFCEDALTAFKSLARAARSTSDFASFDALFKGPSTAVFCRSCGSAHSFRQSRFAVVSHVAPKWAKAPLPHKIISHRNDRNDSECPVRPSLAPGLTIPEAFRSICERCTRPLF